MADSGDDFPVCIAAFYSRSAVLPQSISRFLSGNMQVRNVFSHEVFVGIEDDLCSVFNILF